MPIAVPTVCRLPHTTTKDCHLLTMPVARSGRATQYSTRSHPWKVFQAVLGVDFVTSENASADYNKEGVARRDKQMGKQRNNMKTLKTEAQELVDKLQALEAKRAAHPMVSCRLPRRSVPLSA